MTSIEKIRELTEPLLVDTGLELWDIEMPKGIVRILVEREGGVDLDALTRASNALSGLLDDHPDLVPDDSYQLEVSSPGIERTLRRPDHFRRYLGSLVSIKTLVAVDGQRRWRGILVAVDDDGAEMAPEIGPAGAVSDAGSVRLRFDQIERARTVLVWGSATSGEPVRGSKQAGGSARWSDPRGKGGARRAVRTGAEVKEAP